GDGAGAVADPLDADRSREARAEHVDGDLVDHVGDDPLHLLADLVVERGLRITVPKLVLRVTSEGDDALVILGGPRGSQVALRASLADGITLVVRRDAGVA